MVVTGAGGFIGRATVPAILRRGHAVRALVRPSPTAGPPPWGDDRRVETVRGDVREPAGLADAARGADVVVHLAAAMAGDETTQLASTVTGTEHVLQAMEAAGVRRIVGVSSLAVYDYARGRRWAPLDESSPLEARPERRDAYCRAKLRQEQLIRQTAASRGIEWLILRPGVVYGTGRLWTSRLGLAITSRWWVIDGGRALVPLTFVDNCAEAIALAAERSDVNAVALNVVDDDAPTQLEYARRIQPLLTPRPRLLCVPRPLLAAAAAATYAIDSAVPGRWVPGALAAYRPLAARSRPRRYGNAMLKERLGWTPRWSLDDALQRVRAETPGSSS